MAAVTAEEATASPTTKTEAQLGEQQPASPVSEGDDKKDAKDDPKKGMPVWPP